MKYNINKWQFAGFFVVTLGGTLLHFLYEWSDEMALVAPFSNVNESTWEHMKLLFFPALVFAIVESFFFKDKKDFWSIKLKGTILGLILIPVIFTLFNGIIGKSPDWINIVIFVVTSPHFIQFLLNIIRQSIKYFLFLGAFWDIIKFTLYI